jgi:hypothetical protein
MLLTFSPVDAQAKTLGTCAQTVAHESARDTERVSCLEAKTPQLNQTGVNGLDEQPDSCPCRRRTQSTVCLGPSKQGVLAYR